MKNDAIVSLALILILLQAKILSAIEIDTKDRARYTSLIMTRDEMRQRRAKASSAAQLDEITKLYIAKAQAILLTPITVRFEWDEITSREIFEVISCKIYKAIANDEGDDLSVELRVTIRAKQKLARPDFITESQFIIVVRGRECMVGDVAFEDSSGNVVGYGYLYNPRFDLAIQEGENGLLYLYVPLLELQQTRLVMLKLKDR